jgi:hypothetical protein
MEAYTHLQSYAALRARLTMKRVIEERFSERAFRLRQARTL